MPVQQFIFLNARAAALSAALMAPQALPGFEPPFEPDRTIVIAKPGGSFLGIGVAEIDAERAKALNLKEEYGVEVTRVEDDSPAAQAGLKAADVVLEYNGQRVEGTEQFMRLVRETPPGREVKLTLSRAGAIQHVPVKTGSRKTWMSRYGEMPELPAIAIPQIRTFEMPKTFMSWRSSLLGIETEALDTQLAQYFGVKEGVLVRSVAKASAAERAGFRAGDVILRVDETKVSSPQDLSVAIRASRSKKPLNIQLMRERRELSISLTLDDPSETPHALPRTNVRIR